jgi:nucleoside diphosphate kinase
MAKQRTFSIIKPDATERNLTGAINAVIEKAGLRIVAQKRVRMARRDRPRPSMACIASVRSSANWSIS